MKDTLYNVIIKGCVAICFMAMTISFLYMGCQSQGIVRQLDRYNNLIEQYDTTTQYNRMVLYPQIKACGDSILSE